MTEPIPEHISNPAPPVQQDPEDVPTVGPQPDPDPERLPDPPPDGVDASEAV